jgi:hypothetical protein
VPELPEQVAHTAHYSAIDHHQHTIQHPMSELSRIHHDHAAQWKFFAHAFHHDRYGFVMVSSFCHLVDPALDHFIEQTAGNRICHVADRCVQRMLAAFANVVAGQRSAT